jgi:glycosyltransferase involved in cell wall biosynthesis
MSEPISGFTVCRNAIELDYCVELAIQSMLPVCDEVVVCDSDSTDGTTEMLHAMAASEPRLRIINRPWKEPVARVSWLIEWMQDVQQSLRCPNQLYLDADEVLDPGAYGALVAAPKGRCFWFHRLNYWRDVRHVCPHGHTCSHQVARYGPTALPMHSDEIHDGVQFPLPEPVMRLRAVREPSLYIHHFGFLRKREALFAKCKVVLKAFFGGYDDRLVEAEKDASRPWQDYCLHSVPLIAREGPEPPAFAREWLRERGAL